MAPPRQSLIPREGLVLDVFLTLIRKTVLNPTLTLPLLLLARYTQKGKDLSALHATALKRLNLAVILGLVHRVSSLLSWGSRNNWTSIKVAWNNEIAVVTGGSGGIGGHVVRGLVSKGCKAVIVLDVIPLTYEPAKNVHYYKCDLTNAQEVATTAHLIREQVGHPTILVNNAGVARGQTILSATEKDIRFTFDVNAISHYWTVREFLPAMIENNHGHVVTVASIAAWVSAPQLVDYSASKAAAVSFHEGLGLELKHRYDAPNVRTTLVCQGYTRTPLFTGFLNESRFMFPTLFPETVADGIVNQVASGNGGTVVLPNAISFLAGVRGWAGWLQQGARDRSFRMMNDWQGRQVIDPNKEGTVEGLVEKK